MRKVVGSRPGRVIRKTIMKIVPVLYRGPGCISSATRP